MRNVGYALALASSMMFAGCGGDGGGGNADAAVSQGDGGGGGSDGGGDTPMLVDQVGCHMIGTDYAAVAVPPKNPSSREVYITLLGPTTCLASNTNESADYLRFEWMPGVYYNVKAFGWSVESSTHGEVTTQTNADSAILGVPVSTPVTAMITADADGRTFEIAFRWEDEYVVFTKMVPPGGW